MFRDDETPESELRYNLAGEYSGTPALTESDIETLLKEGELEIEIVGDRRNYPPTIEVVDASRTSAGETDG